MTKELNNTCLLTSVTHLQAALSLTSQEQGHSQRLLQLLASSQHLSGPTTCCSEAHHLQRWQSIFCGL